LQKVAFGKLGLLPDEFWELSPYEFQLMLKGKVEDEERYFEFLENLAVNIMNSKFLKKPAKLAKNHKPHKTDKKKKSLDELKQQFSFINGKEMGG
jgi:predicted translin family RNA/ssDNA-binding protein